VFIPLTRLCRDRCGYCTFVTVPGRLESPYLSPDEVLRIAADGAALGCKEALFTLGDQPEARWPQAREWLDAHGYDDTLSYVPHFGSPDKDPAVRLRVLEDAGRSSVPFTTGILIGIGETLAERADSIFAIRGVAREYGGIQEVIVQNFRAKPDTKMRGVPDAELDDLAGWHAEERSGAFGIALQECEHGFPPHPHARDIFAGDDGLAADVIGDIGEIDAGQLALLAGEL